MTVISQACHMLDQVWAVLVVWIILLDMHETACTSTACALTALVLAVVGLLAVWYRKCHQYLLGCSVQAKTQCNSIKFPWHVAHACEKAMSCVHIMIRQHMKVMKACRTFIKYVSEESASLLRRYHDTLQSFSQLPCISKF